MRDLLTGLAIVLIVVLTTMLAAPYFVDWNAQRSFLEARLSKALGQKVTIGGNIDLKLLPTPYLVLDQTVIGDDQAPITLGIRHLDLELAIAPLLHGEFDITNARLEEPTMRVALRRDRALPTWPRAPAFQADVRFDHIRVSNGTLAIADSRSGHTFVFDNVDLTADASSLAGPFKGAGSEGEAGTRTRFRFSSTTARNGKARTRLVIDETPAHAGLDLDGTLTLTGDGPGALRQSFAGTVAVAGHLRPSGDAAISWALAGPLKVDPAGATLTGGDLRIGPESAGLTLKASGTAEFGATPKLALDLRAKQLDIDRLSGSPLETGKAKPPKLPAFAVLRRIFEAARPPLPTDLELKVAAATWGGKALSAIAVHIGGSTEDRKVSLSGHGPGGVDLALAGTVSARGRNRFEGQLDASAADLPAAADWLASVDPDVTPGGSVLPFKKVAVRGHVTVADDAVAVRDLVLGLDRSALSGHARLDLATKPARLAANLHATTLDLDDLPDLRDLRRSTRAFDLDLALDADAVTVSGTGGAPLGTGPIALALKKSAGHLDLTRFRADDLGGATIEATGSLDPQKAALAMTVDAARLGAAAGLVRRLFPGNLADSLAARAHALAPAKLTIDAAFRGDAAGTLAPSRVAVNGTLGDTRLDAKLEPGAEGGIAVTASAKAPEGVPLLRQLGVAALPIDTIGRSAVTLSANGTLHEPLATKVAARFGATKLDIAGDFDLSTKGRPVGSGAATLESPDVGPLLRSLAIAYPDPTGRTKVEVKAALAARPGGFAFSDLRANVGGIEATGSLRFATEPDQPAVTGALDIGHVDLGGLLGLALGPPQPVAPRAEWSNLAFGTGLIDWPSGTVTLTAKTLDLGKGLRAEAARLDLGFAPRTLTITHLSAQLAGGQVAGALSVRRDGQQAALEGRLSIDKAQVELPGLRTVLSGKLDYGGAGTTAADLVGNLAGTGTATWAQTSIPRADPQGLRKVFDEVEADTLAVDADSIVRALEETDAPLDAGSRSFDVSLVGGALHLAPKGAAPASTSPVTSMIDATLDVAKGTLQENVRETLRALPKSWSASPPSIVVTLAGPPLAPRRGFDVSSFVDAVAARALARASARIEAYEFDVRERAFFNQRLLSERRREQDRLKAEADARAAAARKAAAEAARKAAAEASRRAAAEATRKAAADAARKVEAERRAKAETARLDKQRRDEAKAAREQAARARAEVDQEARDRANAELLRRKSQGGEAPTGSREPPDAGQHTDPSADTRAFEALPPGRTVDPSSAGRY